jgi:hypothetical protein
MRMIVLKPFRDPVSGRQRTKDEVIDMLDETEAERLVKEGYAKKEEAEPPEEGEEA